MKTEKIIKTEIEDLDLRVMEGDNVTDLDDVGEKEMAKFLKCSEELVDSLSMLVADIKESIKNDLKDIWERLDRTENL